MRKFIIVASLILSAVFSVVAQTVEKFDIALYTAPDGWQKKTTADALFFTTEDTTKNVYCAITLFRAFASKGDSRTNFNHAWNSLAADSLKPLSAPQMSAPKSEKGWTVESGAAVFEKNGARGMLMLITLSGGGKMVNVLVLTNTDAYQKQISRFVEALDLPAVNSKQDQPQTTVPNNDSANRSNGISRPVTNFSDGWTATVYSDYVLATKGSLRVFICYPVPIDVSVRQIGNGAYFWRAYVQTLFNAAPQNGRRDDTLGIDFAEGAAVDRQSGKTIFAAMSVAGRDGTARVVIAAAPDRQTYYSEFPRPENLAAKIGANQFAVTLEDLIGDWDGRNAPFVQLYNIYTGNHAGLNSASLSDHFKFNASGAYASRHSAATGMIGSQRLTETNLAGRFQVSDWEVTLTNRENGKTAAFAAYFEAVEGGKILHLTDKQFKGSQFHLFKAN